MRRTRAALDAKRERGEPRGRPSVVDDPALLHWIKRWRARGWTLQKIADKLNAEGVPTLRGGSEWRPSAVHRAVGHVRAPSAPTAPDPEPRSYCSRRRPGGASQT